MSHYICQGCTHNNNGWCKKRQTHVCKRNNLQICEYYCYIDSTPHIKLPIGCTMEMYNEGKISMYYLYFIEEQGYRFYGGGDMLYIMQILNDYLNIHKMHGKKEIDFRVTSELIKIILR